MNVLHFSFVLRCKVMLFSGNKQDFIKKMHSMDSLFLLRRPKHLVSFDIQAFGRMNFTPGEVV